VNPGPSMFGAMAWSGRIAALTLVLGNLVGATKPPCRELYTDGEPWRNCSIQIGGLAIQGADAFNAAQGPTFRDYLTASFNDSHGLEFEAIPLNFNQNFEYVGGKQLDFIYSNPGAYTCMMVEFSIVTVASLYNFRAGNSLERFAGVIFSRKDSNFSTIEDLRRARVEAVSISGLGAMQLQQAELLNLGIDVMTDVKRLSFAYNQNKIVQDVQNGYADVGFVRTDMIDRSVGANKTKWEYFQVINEIPDDEFPFKRSTAFTPEWPIGALPHVPFEIMELVAIELMKLDRFSSNPVLSSPGIAGKFATWVTPMNYLGLLGMLENIGYYDPDQRKCLRSADLYAAIRCPAGYVKQSEDRVFCESDCKEGYDCLCQPCSKLEDPALVLNAEALPTPWLGGIDVPSLEAQTIFELSCTRMGRCAQMASGQYVRWTILDQIGLANRLQINAPVLSSVEMRLRFDSDWEVMAVENATLPDGVPTQRYVLDSVVGEVGTHIVQIRVNGEQAPMSPVVVAHFEAPERQVDCGPGEEAEADGSCTACPPGSYGDIDVEGDLRRHVCRVCRAGTHQPLANQSHCVLCPMGAVSPEMGALECKQCDVGRSTVGKEGKSTCEPCEPGQEAPEVGLGRCSFCERGRFSDLEGAPACTTCSQGMTTVDVGGQNSSACGCAGGTYLAAAPDGQKQCKACLEIGTNCPGFGTPPLLQPGFYMAEDSPRDAWDLDVWRCMSADACPGQLAISDALCAGIRIGLNCAKCPEGFSVEGLAGCVACAAGGGGQAVALLVFCLVVLFIAFGITAWKLNRDEARSVTRSVALGLALQLLQTVSIFGLLNFSWPSGTGSVFRASSAVLLDLKQLQISCAVYETTASSYVLPLLIPALALVYALAWHPLSRGVAQLKPSHFQKLEVPALANTIGMLSVAFFISIVSATVSILDCYESPNLEKTVRSQPYTICWEGAHTNLLPVTSLALLLYVAGIFAALCVTAWKAPQHYTNRRFQDGTVFLFLKYHARAWWFGIVQLVRSTLLALVTIISPNDAYAQFLMVVLIFVASLALHVMFMPYKEALANALEVLQLGVLITVIMLGSWFMNTESGREAESGTGDALNVVMLLCLIVNALGLIGATVYTLVEECVGLGAARREPQKARLTQELQGACAKVALLDATQMQRLVDLSSCTDIVALKEVIALVGLEVQYEGEPAGPPAGSLAASIKRLPSPAGVLVDKQHLSLNRPAEVTCVV